MLWQQRPWRRARQTEPTTARGRRRPPDPARCRPRSRLLLRHLKKILVGRQSGRPPTSKHSLACLWPAPGARPMSHRPAGGAVPTARVLWRVAYCCRAVRCPAPIARCTSARRAVVVVAGPAFRVIFRCIFKTANGNPLKHKKPHKKTQQNRNRRTHPKRGTHKSHKEGKTKDTTRTKHTNTNTQKHEHPHTQATSPKGHPHPHNDTQTTNQTPYTTTKPHPSDAESARHTTEGRQGVARSPKS
jgi:hypothetical protein